MNGGFPDDGCNVCPSWNVFSRECEPVDVTKTCSDAFPGQVISVSRQSGERDLAVNAVFQCPDPCRLGARFRFDGRTAAGNERKRNAVDFRILRVEKPFFVNGVTGAPQCPSHDLFTQQLRTESPDAQNVGDRVRVPAFRKHRNADNTPDLFAQLPRLADGVHDFTKQILVRQLFDITPGESRTVIRLEFFNLECRQLFEVVAHRVAGLKLLTVNEDSVRTFQPTTGAVIVTEYRELSALHVCRNFHPQNGSMRPVWLGGRVPQGWCKKVVIGTNAGVCDTKNWPDWA